MTDHIIKNEQWYVKELISKIDNKSIKKPQYQRKKKWDITPKKENNPNEQYYIEFLYTNQNSVHPITFGQETLDSSLIYSNIDGNNRINAINHFLKKPFEIFEKYLHNLNNIICNSNCEYKEEIKIIFSSLSYNEFVNIKRLNKFFTYIHKSDIYDKFPNGLCDDITEEIEVIQKRLLINGEDKFDAHVIVNVNIFEGYNTEELCETFEQINKFNSVLTETELLSCRLFDVVNFSINDNVLKSSLDNSIIEYYKKKSEGEILDCYEYTSDCVMNAHDFIMGLQYLHSNTYSFIDEPDSSGLSLYFKLWYALYSGYGKQYFTTKNVNDFIEKIDYSCEILNEAYDKIFTDKINGKLFNNSVKKKAESLKKNNMFIIFTCIIGYKNKNIEKNEIILALERCIIYHFFTSDIKDKDNREVYKNNDKIAYTAGGAFIRDITKKLLYDPYILTKNLNEGLFNKLLNSLFSENNNPYERKLPNGKLRNEKRRSLKFFEKTCMFYYYKINMPTNMLDNEFSIEHIIPNSSDWVDNIDKDRTGNLFPIFSKINSSRGNKHINTYSKSLEGSNFLKFVKDVIPNDSKYDNIVKFETKPIIVDNELYNELCDKNEKVYTECMIKCLFSK